MLKFNRLKKLVISLLFSFTLFILFSSSFANADACSGNLNCNSLISTYGGTTTYTIYNNVAALRAGCSCTCSSGSCSYCSNIYSQCSSFTSSSGCMPGTGCTWTGCSSGPCCVGGQIAGSSTSCATLGTTFSCSSQQITVSTTVQYCNGVSTSCSGSTSTIGPSVIATCGPFPGYCIEGATSPAYISCGWCADSCASHGYECGTYSWCGFNINCGNCGDYGRSTDFCSTTYGSGYGTCYPRCDPHTANCDGNRRNGCETALGTNTNCASCGNTCGSGYSCQNYVCACTPQTSYACYGPDLYWYDSCGNLGSMKQNCNGLGCNNAPNPDVCNTCTCFDTTTCSSSNNGKRCGGCLFNVDVSGTAETCNGKDDNCNGQIDEGLTQSQTCWSAANCAGQTNSATQTRSCSAGSWGSWSSCTASRPADPTCSGSSTQSCTVGVGACQRTGTQTRSCNCGSWGAYGSCSVSAGSPSAEVCDNQDNDCDGMTDEGLTQSQTCWSAANCAGQTNSATQTRICTAGSWGAFSSCTATRPADPTCSGSTTQTCWSAANCAGQTNSATQTRSCSCGSWGAFSSCTATRPADPTCSGSTTQSCTGSIPNSATATQSRTCTCGSWSGWSACTLGTCNSGYTKSGNVCNPTTCSGNDYQACSIANGVGIQYRTCNLGVWSGWGACGVDYCNSCYVQSGNSCVAQTCSGSNSQSCTVGVGACQRTGTQTRSCNCGSWGAYGACSVSAGSPTAETCNNIDDNCDSFVDNGIAPQTQSCVVTGGNGTQSRTCSAGSWSAYSTCCATSCGNGYSLSGCSCVAVACTPGSGTQSCVLANASTALQTRACNNPPNWDVWGACCATSCNSGYTLGGCYCSPSLCSGSGIDDCTVMIANASSANRTMTCNLGVWGAPYGTCNLASCSAGFTKSGNVCTPISCVGSTTQPCAITNGTGQENRSCISGNWSNWSSCNVVSCDSGFTQSGNACVSGAVCGDNVKQAPNSVGFMETCDGTDLGGKSCSDFVSPTGNNFDGGTLKCLGGCNGFNTSLCRYCGDGVKNDAEQCDDGNVINGDGCSSTCQLESCGDGNVNGLEECDDGLVNNGWGKRCSGACTWQNCTINSITFAPNCYIGPFSNNVFACAGGNGFDATVNFTGTNCSKASYVQVDLSNNGACGVDFIGSTSGLADSGSNFISTPSNVGNNVYTVHFNLTGFASDNCTGSVMTNYTALLRGGIGTPPPGRSKDLKLGLLNNNITLSQCNLNSYTSYDAIRFPESPQFVVINTTPISNVCDKFFVKNTVTNSSGTKNLKIINNSVTLNYTCGVLDAVCPDDFSAVTVCGYNSSGYPIDPDCGTHVWMKCSNVTLNHTAPFTSLGPVTCTPSIVPSNTHRACLNSSGCMYYDGISKNCFVRGNLINTTNGFISCSVNNNVWCIPGFEYDQVLKICTRVSTTCDEGVGTTNSVNGCGTLRYAIMYQGLGHGNNDTAAIIDKCMATETTSGKYITVCSPATYWGGYYFYNQQNITVK